MSKIIRLSLITASIAFLSIVIAYNGCAPIETASNSSTTSTGGNTGGGGNGGGGLIVAKTPGETYYKNVLKPLFREENQCIKCHGSPREILARGGVDGGLSVTESYNTSRTQLLDGTSSTDNYFLNVTRNIVFHPSGGNRCAVFGLLDTPCKEILEWYQLETNTNATVPGSLSSVTGLGKVVGWAADFGDTTKSVTVNIYINGPSGTGDFLGASLANLSGPSGGFPGNHKFEYQLAAIYRDKVERMVYAYGIDIDGNEVLLNGSPAKAVAYQSSAAGTAYFNSTVNPMLQNQCSACHVYDFNEAFTRLLTPTPADGGTRSNNRLFFYGTGNNGHAGGNACNGCSELQTWYDQAFN